MDNKLITGITPTKCLNWIYRKNPENYVYPPAVADISDEYYQLNAFETYSQEYFVIKADSLEHALNISVELYGNASLNTVELAYLTTVCEKLDIDKSEINAFALHGIKGKKNFETLKAITSFCPVIQKYLSVKAIPLKTIAVFAKLDKEFRRFIRNTLEDKELSVQDFRKMVNILFDMQAQATDEDMGPDLLKKLTEKKDMTRLSFMKEMQNLTQGVSVDIFSDNNFETGELTFSFKASSIEEMQKKADSLSLESEKIKNIYRFLDEQDIC
ncbi:hypothetical protein Dacet_2224 [Denitrovibrio acetiphilus DSM 12809]|uniref:Uncharacterized protein n=1 Tax=Denitrovibrio acetiphilus (strain DSM 12809 / NBRC 114555 / N2460) TaxID=522772 RepID=D4H2W3_DENA2|nr:hypothetical protein [Denitrovibrio acetiphilus]ADD68986.1 hypothetical protein Dacet_2224 [Denitrovibrio acetiphilus DSM 12809]